jgi:hypothetical protein
LDASPVEAGVVAVVEDRLDPAVVRLDRLDELEPHAATAAAHPRLNSTVVHLVRTGAG